MKMPRVNRACDLYLEHDKLESNKWPTYQILVSVYIH